MSGARRWRPENLDVYLFVIRDTNHTNPFIRFHQSTQKLLQDCTIESRL